MRNKLIIALALFLAGFSDAAEARAQSALTAPSHPSQCGQLAPPLAVRAPCTPSRTTTSVLIGGFWDYVKGNRSRMIQIAFIGFAVGVVILITSTRKH
ncbi:MAG: hypothetical protein L0Y72_08725 [Gemmataceae bacterium]|nr:hypothetical protein [Gemmataceae bacterium]MCI0739115.1 hypothetical protein [Gemmataceae bacterium]